MHTWITGILDLFFPHLCAGCGDKLVRGEASICTMCLHTFPETNSHLLPDNPIVYRLRDTLPITYGLALYWLHKQSALEKVLFAMKYKNQPNIGTLLGQQYGTILCKEPFVKTIDGIVSIPLHPKRFQERGYNQSDFIARGLSSILHLPFYPNCIARVRNTPSQTNKNKPERMENLQKAFQVSIPHLIADKHLLLVDDIVTTGATLSMCTEELFAKGAKAISVATLAVVA